MPDLPETLRLAYHAERPHPRDVPLREVYLDLDFPSGVGDRPFVYVNMVQTFDGQAVLKGSAYTIGTDVDHYLLRQLRHAPQRRRDHRDPSAPAGTTRAGGQVP